MGATFIFLTLLTRQRRNPSNPTARNANALPTPAPIALPRLDGLDFAADVDEDFDAASSESVAAPVAAEVGLIFPEKSVVVIVLTSFSTVAVTVTLAAVAVVVCIPPFIELIAASSASWPGPNAYPDPENVKLDSQQL